MNRYQRIYRLLLGHFGRQGWWPINGAYHPGNFKIPVTNRERLEICLGAVLTQNTAWTNVNRALANLRAAKLIDAKKIMRVKLIRLARLIRPAGYFNQKAKKLKLFCAAYDADPDGLLDGDLAAARQRLLAIWGIGRETADSILLYAGHRRIFVVDAYTRRIFYRHGLIKDEAVDYDYIRKKVETAIPADYRMYNEFHALLVACAKHYCDKRNPCCEECPLARRAPARPANVRGIIGG